MLAADVRLLICELQIYQEASNPTAITRMAALQAWTSTSGQKRKAAPRAEIDVPRARAHSEHTRPTSALKTPHSEHPFALLSTRLIQRATGEWQIGRPRKRFAKAHRSFA